MRGIKLMFMIAGGFLIIIWGLGTLIGVWLPDVVFAPRNIIASTNLANGYTFEVVQYWNRCDFYSTELHVHKPETPTAVHLLDADDSKSWSVPLNVDQQNRIVTVTLGGGRAKQVQY